MAKAAFNSDTYYMPFFRLALASLLLIQISSLRCLAAEGEPMAVRVWPDNVITLETHWGHHLVLVPGGSDKVPGDVDHVIQSGRDYDHVISRLPNDAATSLIEFDKAGQDPNGVRIKTHVGMNANPMMSIRVDGVQIVLTSDIVGLASPRDVSIDLAVLTGNPISKAEAEQMVAAISKSNVRCLLINAELGEGAAKVFAESGDGEFQVEHNTLAICSATVKSTSTRFVRLSDQAWEMPADFEREFTAMEKSCAASQTVFAKLSKEQMNFKPENGTHTPRWNAEHMMGRQLQFFSQIYHSVDPTIPVMDLNPKQMPADYTFKHSGWDGAEEARQMQRVSDFTRRFAYLLQGKKLSDKATGTFWPNFRALLVQMQRHYSEHTANTIEKFELPGFPVK